MSGPHPLADMKLKCVQIAGATHEWLQLRLQDSIAGATHEWLQLRLQDSGLVRLDLLLLMHQLELEDVMFCVQSLSLAFNILDWVKVQSQVRFGLQG